MKLTPKNIKKGGICILGIPLDKNSSFLRGSRCAPKKIRDSYYSDSSNLWSETGLDLGNIDQLYDSGDINFKDNTNEFALITQSVKNILDTNCNLVSLGGDHSITFPIIEAYSQKYDDLNILHLDAHPDLYDNLQGNIHSHACPFARIMEKKFAKRLVQAGIRTMNGHQREQANKFSVQVHEMKDGNNWLDKLDFSGPVYLSLDLDCLDPGFAPGVSHHEPGGMNTRHVIDIIQRLKGKLIGADIVELNPDRDINSMTSMVAAKLLKEIIARIYNDKV
jgi:arginase